MRTMILIVKTTVWLAGVIVVIGAVLVCGYTGSQYLSGPHTQHETTVISSPTVTGIQDLLALVTHRINVSDVLIAERKTRFTLVKGAWIVKGDALLGVDVTQAWIQLDTTNRHASVALPNPKVIQARVDHAKTKTYDVTKTWWADKDAESEIRDKAMASAQELIETAAGNAENITLAKERVEQDLAAAFKFLGWTVAIEWNCGVTTGTFTQFGTRRHQEKTL